MTKDELQTRALALIEDLARTNARLRELGRRKGEAETEYRKRHAMEMILAEDLKSDKLRQATADLNAAKEMGSYKQVESELSVMIEVGRNQRGSLSAIQTLLGVEKSEAELTRYGQQAGA